ncbi:MAG TPA: N-acetylmuramoyl-L-alanine amidase [Caulobacteraceae bacterium]|jgi:N-acetylmuramoyl-L-alanine amidase
MSLIPAPSPNFNERPRAPDMVVLHYTGMTDGPSALARLRDPEAQVSSHYLVEEDGRVFGLVAEDRRAWHAGVSFWRGERDINGCSIGIEIVNPGHEFGYRDFPDVQVEGVIGLLDDIRSRHRIPDSRILGHSDVAPDRKQDPGERFPWRRLARAGHGLWTEPDPVSGADLCEGDKGEAVLRLQADLSGLGYDQDLSGYLDAATRARVVAFQRHWVQVRVDGVADSQTRVRLNALAALSLDAGP